MSSEIHKGWIRTTALMCAALLVRGVTVVQTPPQPGQLAPKEAPAKLPSAQLDSLVAPIALYPDPLLAQVLAASTYPLELVQLQQWLTKHKDLKDKALADAVQKEPWDPSIQAMAALPDAVKLLAENIQWTSELGNAFLAQQSEVMDAVQRMRAKAKTSGNLKSNEQLKVETKVVESKSVVVIEQANPQVVYVPSYNPTVVYGAAPVYAYPPVAYPPVGYYAAGAAISFGVGVAMGAMWSGGWGWNSGWGGNNDITINNNNNFNRNSTRNTSAGNTRNTAAGSGNRSSWQHNPEHRGGAPYGDRGTADRFGGTARGDSLGTRQTNARNETARNDRNVGANRGAANDRNVGGNAFDGDRNAGANRGGANDRNVGANRGAGNSGNVGGNRGDSGADRIGNRQASGADAGRSSGAFNGAGRTSGSAASANRSRGASSFSGSRGGGGGGRRGGGGGRRR